MRPKKGDMKRIKVIDLFAGVGGFRLGLQRASTSDLKFDFVWGNQWEPSSRKQEAFEIYARRFNDSPCSNQDIAKVDIHDIPVHDLLVGGFPCQDYSVARPLNQAKGIVGKKGVLWWEIHRILFQKKKKPSLLFLENVDRLLKSPAEQRGKDFAILLASLSDLGYIVEWRVINAADYGMPQRRRRVFILGYRRGSPIYKKIKRVSCLPDWILETGVLAKSFPAIRRDRGLLNVPSLEIRGDLMEISRAFNKEALNKAPFANAGVMIDRVVWTLDAIPDYHGSRATMGAVLVTESEVPDSFFLDAKDIERWAYLKGAKDEERHNKKHDFSYRYNEGPIPFPDPLDKPSRTIITSEGGASPSRFKHVIRTKSGRLRRLLPIELERLNMFPDNHTDIEGCTDIKRAFLMGNALVVGVIERIGRQLAIEIVESDKTPLKKSMD